METLFWTSVLVVVYVYAGYPLALAAWSRFGGRQVRRRATSAPRSWPSVSVLLPVHNEAARLEGRISNLIDQIYPGALEVIVVSDGSTDDTRAIVASFADRVRYVELPRGGKPLALNAGVAAATGDIIVFADARQRFAPDALVELVADFDDPDVGGVTGELILDCEMASSDSGSTVGDGVGLYWRYEKWLRRRESRVKSTLGATGAIYALRRSLWQPLPAHTLLDDVLAPMRVVLAGRRVLFEERARAFDRVAPNAAAESRRKVRTLAGNYQILRLEPRLLLPWTNPVWLQYMSHKVGRLLAPWALFLLFVTSAVLAVGSWFYLVALILQLGFYGLAAIGAWMESSERESVRIDELAALSTRETSSLPARRIPRISGGTGA